MKHTIWQDIHSGLRILARNPGSSALAILVTIVLGITASASISLLMKAAHRRDLTVRGAGQFVVIASRDSDGPASLSFSYPMSLDLREKARVVSGVAARCKAELSLMCPSGGERIRGELVSGNYFAVLGTRPWLGRLISEEDDHESITFPVAVISYGFWKCHFAMDPFVLNRTLILNGYRFKIIGVTPPGFVGTDRTNGADVQVPLTIMKVFTPPVLRATRVDPTVTFSYE
jgi:putative ABC transport system permease protein